MTLLDIAVVDDIFLEFIALNDPLVSKKGICVIIDMANYNWRLLKWLAPEYVKIGTKKLQSLPYKEWRYHVVNNSFIVNVALKLVWPFLPEHLKKMVSGKQMSYVKWADLKSKTIPEFVSTVTGLFS